MTTDHPFTNKLITEKSPYLLLYAHTPVDWYPWSAEAFHKASSEDKPIFLSIGCTHSKWCQVMLKENYENPEVAAILNEYFVCIKVDKEELPHLANLYFELSQMLSVSGEVQDLPTWPLNVFLTPNLLPFFSLGYANFSGKMGASSFVQMLEKLHAMWEDREDREVLVQQAEKVIEVAAFLEECSFKKEPLDEKKLKLVTEDIYQDVDAQFGGVKSFPKTLPGLLSLFLLRIGAEYQDGRAIFFVNRSLRTVASGGIFDHLSGGFFCYTIDDRWLIPCFEKRAFDNTLMMLVYAEAGIYMRNPEFILVAKRVLSYLIKELYDFETGAFYISEYAQQRGETDIDSQYTWSGEEIRSLLGDNAEMFCEYYDVSREGICNGRNILHISPYVDNKEIAERYRCSSEEFQARLEASREKLRVYRAGKTKSFKDDQSLTFQNGWGIFSLIKTGLLLGSSECFQMAEKCGDFISKNLYKNGRLLRRWRQGEAKYSAGLDDYASVIMGSLALFEIGAGAKWLVFAEELTKEVLISFRSETGSFYSTDGRDSSLLIKKISLADGDSISGNALFCQSLLKLHIISGKKHYLTFAEDILQCVQGRWLKHKFSSLGGLIAAQEYFSKQHQKIIISLGNEQNREQILDCFKGIFLPHTSLVWLTAKDREILTTCLPESEQRLIPSREDGVTKIYFLDQTCGRIFSSLEHFRAFLSSQC
ncbi:thioredoxin domain-containing protein [Chlamydia sp.]|uniref:thioredoxin domain-containing protein n=1 Tax=Chlamydia sp. TaxID=35827 RepID=UPI0025C0B648|nr:thioredoxin domain-containing protein [Chlamydia sp.]MBQ8498240.1 thioredoxin domain-containing protein [Chlamydia sp.]